MKKALKLSFVALIATLFFSSCSPAVYTVKGNYNVVKSIETSTPYDVVWNRVIDYFADNNIPIVTIEKESGIIVTDYIRFDIHLCAEEDSDGKIDNPNAWFVAPNVPLGGDLLSLHASFNVRVRKMEDGNTYIGINLGKASVERWVVGLLVTAKEFHTCASTGNFERQLFSLFEKAY